MMRSLFSGVSGLRVHQTKMDVIANNIANVNTIGYKSSRVTFKDAFYQRIQGAAGPSYETGRAGTNPMQIGLGANVASIDTIMTQGASQRTDNSFDVMIQGSGFFIVSDTSGTYFTRAGNISLDYEMNMHINGMKLMGWDAQYNTTSGKYEIVNGPVQPLSLKDKQSVPASSTSIIDMVGNLNPNELPESGKIERTMSFYDSEGSLLTVTVEFEYVPNTTSGNSPDFNSNFWVYRFKTGTGTDEAGNAVTGVMATINGDESNTALINLSFDGQPTAAPAYNPNTVGYLVFNTTGTLTSFGTATQATASGVTTYSPVSPANTGSIGSTVPPRFNLYCTPLVYLTPKATIGSNPIEYGGNTGLAAKTGVISLDFSELYQFDGENITQKVLMRDGNTPGTLEDISVDASGKVTGRYSNGETRLLCQIPVAKFRNAAGLEKVGNSLFAATNNSGAFDGVGEVGDIMGGALEMSNVDLSLEFTEMITTQRGFQANSRVITTSDDMLQELVNLKR